MSSGGVVESRFSFPQVMTVLGGPREISSGGVELTVLATYRK